MNAECLGCGYCCKKARCVASFVAENTYHRDILGTDTHCPFLYEENGKYRCNLAKYPRFARALAMGAGCSSSLNSERRKYAKSQAKTPQKP